MGCLVLIIVWLLVILADRDLAVVGVVLLVVGWLLGLMDAS